MLFFEGPKRQQVDISGEGGIEKSIGDVESRFQLNCSGLILYRRFWSYVVNFAFISVMIVFLVRHFLKVERSICLN